MKPVYTLEELKARMATLEETYLLELLEINSEMLVERFSDLIETDPEKFENDFEEDEDE